MTSAQTEENCAPLSYYAESIGNFLMTFRDNLSVPISWLKNVNAEDGTAALSPKRR
jgi:hypothetical protein